MLAGIRGCSEGDIKIINRAYNVIRTIKSCLKTLKSMIGYLPTLNISFSDLSLSSVLFDLGFSRRKASNDVIQVEIVLFELSVYLLRDF